MIKSPIVIREDFLSPLMCESIIMQLNNRFPNYVNDKPVKTVNINKLLELRILPLLDDIITKEFQQYYNFTYKGIFEMGFEWFVANCVPEPPRVENEVLFGGKWVRTEERDFTGIIFLNDHNDKPPFDDEFEVFGGKLQFHNHKFSIAPKRGTLVFFPSENRFTNNNSLVQHGELNQIRFHVAAKDPYVYDMNKFPGNYSTWFK